MLFYVCWSHRLIWFWYVWLSLCVSPYVCILYVISLVYSFLQKTYRYCKIPFYKYASLNCVDNTPEPWLFLGPPPHHAHLSGEGGGQPITNLHRYRVRLDVTELILGVQESPAKHRITPSEMIQSLSVKAWRQGWFCYSISALILNTQEGFLKATSQTTTKNKNTVYPKIFKIYLRNKGEKLCIHNIQIFNIVSQRQQ